VGRPPARRTPEPGEQVDSDNPAFRLLDRAESEAVLRRNCVGRIAYALHDQVDIEPVNYVFSEGWLWCRTSEGAKWHVLAENAYRWWPVAFEVDEVEGLFHWRSVVVKGGFQALDPPADGGDPAVWDEALERLRDLVPQAFTGADPVARRNRVFRIAVQEMTGREAIPPDASPDHTPTDGRGGSTPDARRS
jgi:uncharacterized protein